MSEKITALIIDGVSGEVVERELSTDEILERQTLQAEVQAIHEARANAKASALAKLAALGLTEEEIAAL